MWGRTWRISRRWHTCWDTWPRWLSDRASCSRSRMRCWRRSPSPWRQIGLSSRWAGVGSPSPATPDRRGPACGPQSTGREQKSLRHCHQGHPGAAWPYPGRASAPLQSVGAHRGGPTLRPAAAGPSQEVAGPGPEHNGGDHGAGCPCPLPTVRARHTVSR